MVKCIYLIEFIIVILAAVIFRKIFKTSKIRFSFAGVGAVLFVFAILCNYWASSVPPLMETISIKALGEKNAAASAAEVSITGFTVNGKNYIVKNPLEGKWFYSGNTYMWRPETDSRQPENCTRDILLRLPVGTNRQINFVKTPRSGKAEISLYEETFTIDTFTANTAAIPNSSIKLQILNIGYKAGVFLLFFALSCGILFLYIRAFSSEKISQRIKNRLVYGGVAASFLLLAAAYSEGQAFWLDEIYQIGFSGTGKSLYETLMVTETTPPLFRLAANVWYNLVPYGEEWLLLLPELFCAASVYAMGILGEKLGNYRTGFFSALFIAVSITILTSAAYEFRSYSFLLFFSAAFLVSYCDRLQKGKNAGWKEYLKTGLWMIPLAYTHYFGVFLCGAAFLLDGVLVIRKRISWKCVSSYIFVFISYIPWIYRFLQLRQISLDASWQTKPSLAATVNLVKYLCGNNDLVLFFFLAGLLAILFGCFSGNDFIQEHFIRLVPCYFLTAILAGLYCYGTFVKASATLWVNRYFLCVYPCAAFLAAWGADRLLEKVEILLQGEKREELSPSFKRLQKYTAALLAVCLLFAYVPQASRKYSSGNYPYKEAADWLYAQPDIYNGSTLVIMAAQTYVGDGWYEYYMTRKGERDAVNYISQEALLKEPEKYGEVFASYDTVYYCYIANQTNSGLLDFLFSEYAGVADNASLKIKTYTRA